MTIFRRFTRRALPVGVTVGTGALAADSYNRRFGRASALPVTDINPDRPVVFDPENRTSDSRTTDNPSGPNPWRRGQPIPIGRHGDIPQVLFRGDKREPAVILNESENRFNSKTRQITGPGGFRARGVTGEGLPEEFTHLMHQETNTEDVVSFSKDAYTAAAGFGARYLYALDSTGIRDAVDYNATLPPSHYGAQHEVASRQGVPAASIIMHAEVFLDDQPRYMAGRNATQYVSKMIAPTVDRETWREKFNAHQAAAAAFDLADWQLRTDAPMPSDPFEQELDESAEIP